MTTTERMAIGVGSSQAGMIVYDTDIQRYMFFNGTVWNRVGDGLWMTSGSGIQNAVNNVGIGTNPIANLPLVVNGTVLQEVARFGTSYNTLMTFYKGNVYSGFIQAYEDDFYFGKTAGAGQVVLFNQSSSHLELDPQGDVSIGIAGPVANRLRVEGATNSTFPVVASLSNYVGNSDVRAFHGMSIPNPGWGYGGDFTGGYRGVVGTANGTTFIGEAIGVYGVATGTAGTRTGIFGSATGGTTNWAGYFNAGHVYISNELRMGDSGGAAGYKLAVDGKIICEELKVQNSTAWPDYVFSKDYQLMPIRDLETHIALHHHLPGIPSAVEIEANGIMVGDMQKRMMEKIEELTLYIIAQEKRIAELEAKSNSSANSNSNSN